MAEQRPSSNHCSGGSRVGIPRVSIDYQRPAGSVVELTRFQLREMTFDDRETAEIFGLEIARLLLDTGYREFEIARDETDKQVAKTTTFPPVTMAVPRESNKCPI